MHSGEMEFQIITRVLAVIHDQINIISNSASTLSLLNNSVFQEQNNDIESSGERIRSNEDNIKNIRKKITRNVVKIGNLISYKENILRTVYVIDKITRIISGVAFRGSNLKISILRQAKFDNGIIALIEKVIEYVYKFNEIARALSINQRNIIELTYRIQKVEGRIDLKNRNSLVKVFDVIENTKELILFKKLLKQLKRRNGIQMSRDFSFTIVT